MASVPTTCLTTEQYLARERQADFKSQFFRGECFAMAGASARHNLIVANCITCLNNQLKDRPCLVYPSDLKLEVQELGLITYPDLSVVCGPPEFGYDRGDVLRNPVVLVEVLSESTESYDRGVKFDHYRRLPSLRHYVLVSQDHAAVDVFSWSPATDVSPAGWLLTYSRSLSESVALPAIGCHLPLAEVYAKVEPLEESLPTTDPKISR